MVDTTFRIVDRIIRNVDSTMKIVDAMITTVDAMIKFIDRTYMALSGANSFHVRKKARHKKYYKEIIKKNYYTEQVSYIASTMD